MQKKYYHKEIFTTEKGDQIHNLEIAYQTFGAMNKDQSNVVWICHALTANSDPTDWWDGLVGNAHLVNPQEYFIVCANNLGSCYGTTHPLSINPKSEKLYFFDFPFISIRDMVKAHQLLCNHLGIQRIKLLMGGSMGGQQAMEWAISEPEKIENLFLIATNAYHSPWGIAFNQSQRLALESDISFRQNPTPNGGSKGLKAARSIALLSYRNYQTYKVSQSETNDNVIENHKSSSYQNYQGDKLVKRFDAYSYYYLSKAMDSHNVGRARLSKEWALQQIKAKTLVVSINSDLLFPPDEQKYLTQHIPNSVYKCIDSLYGHDGFLLETKQIAELLKEHILI